jgi:lipopolysaccharide transport system permease protein
MSKSVTSIKYLINSTLESKELIIALTKREVIGRYKGSFIGMLWPFITPLFMLGIYTFFFGRIFNARWNMQASTDGEFALLLFIGLIIFNLYAESINRASLLIISNVNYVKKVIFPLEILAIVSVLSGLFHAIVSLVVWVIVYTIIFGVPSLYICYFVLIIIPFVLILIGLSWILSAIGTYIKDIIQVVGVITSALMFLSPVFFPLESLPESFRKFVMLNPLSMPIEQLRLVMFYGKEPNWVGLMQYSLVSVFIFYLGFYFFQKVRRGFADVV